jgi:hypothetical protein
LHASGFDAADIQNVVDDPQKVLAAGKNVAQQLAFFFPALA